VRITSPDCGEEYPLDTFEWVCVRCGGHLEIEGARAFDPAAIDRSVASLWRYHAMLPLPSGAEPVTMGEGWTPLISARIAPRETTRRVVFKLDFMMPSGSFKDRGSTVLVSALKAMNITRIVEDSSGNAAASLAAYAARAGLGAEIFVPSHASPMKLAQIQAYGATLRPVEGPRENSARAAQDAVVHHGAYYASHYYNPFALFGMQTTAWELWEQLDGRPPDNVVVPVGHGTNLVGMYRGFVTLRERGMIDRLPRFFAAQAENVAPLALAFVRGKTEPSAVEASRTIAEGIAITRPARGVEILRVVRETGGAVIAVGEDEIRTARANLALEGIFVEPTSATAVAALEKIQDLTGVTVVSLTGSGLKSL
jgi:threonine synthase